MRAVPDLARRSTFLTAWAVLLVLSSLVLGSLLVFTFGLVCFAGLTHLWWRETTGKRSQSLPLLNGVMLGMSTIWFAVNVLAELFPSNRFHFGMLGMGFLYPPLILHLYYLEATRESGLQRRWRRAVVLSYLVAVAFSIFIGLATFGIVPGPDSPPELVALFTVFLGLFVFAGGFSAYMLSRSPLRRERVHREQRRVNITLLIGMVLMILVILVANQQRLFEFGAFLSVVSRALPLIFLFANSYYENRFEFFDVFVKRATFFFVAIIFLMGYFSLVPSLIARMSVADWQLPSVYALTLAPFVIALPWVYRALGTWLDLHWLGRTFEPTAAVKYFLEGLGNSTTAAELTAAAETRISEIFQAPVSVRLDAPGPDPEFRVLQRVAIAAHGAGGGWILLGPRPNQTPWFGGDLMLVSAMAEVFSFMLQNIRLQTRKQEQEKREQQLVLEASRSELKALRAQINPHFLFNALNAIASLTHRNPDLAESVVEQLAEVFRYTLTRSDQEWVRIEDELAFIQAYLAVERARFGDRLKYRIEARPDVRQRLIPAMIIQTLVENAVKHGISALRSGGLITVAVECDGDMVRLSVADNGPGPEAAEDGGRAKGAGYGLHNIRRRLAGYFGDRALLEVKRDPGTAMTVASVHFPSGSPMPVSGRVH